MKPFHKILAALMAVVLAASAAGCVPFSLSKDWGYKYEDKTLNKEYDIGMYIYSLYQAYNQAKSYAQSAKGYKESESFVNLKIKDDDGKKAVAGDWIKDRAEELMLNAIALDYLCKKDGATWDEAAMTSAKSTAKDSWEMGPYASYGYYQPIKDEVEKYGVSLESYTYLAGDSSVKQQALFTKLYDKKGLEEVKDKELKDYFLKNYTDCSYIPVNLYTSSTDADGNSSSKKFGKKKIKTIKSELEALAEDISNGDTTFDKASEKCQKDYSVASTDVVKDNIATKSDLKQNNADIYKAYNKLKNGEASSIVVGESGDSPIAYIVVKNNINNQVKDYLNNSSNRTTVLQNMKSEDFTDFIEKTGKELKKSKALTINEGAINKYAADIFFEKPEETTAATTSA